MKENDKRLNAYKKIAEFKPQKLSRDETTGEKKSSSPGVKQSDPSSVQSFTPFNLADYASKKQLPVSEAVNTKRETPVQDKQTTSSKNTIPVEQTIPGRQTENQANDQNSLNDYMDRRGLIKVALSGSEGGKDSLYRRVAKFLLLIGVDEAAKILPHLTPEQTEKIIPEIASIRRVDPDEASVILAEFENLVQRARESGGVTTARSILEKAFGAERAGQMIKKTVTFPDGKPFDYLQESDGERLYQLLKGESPAVSALVLSHVKSASAAQAINLMNAEEKKNVIYRLAKLQKVDPDVVSRVDRAMKEKNQTLSMTKADTIDGRGALADILKRMSGAAERDILSSLENTDPELGRDLRERLFTVEDILRSDDRFLQKKLQTMEDADIAFLIAGKKDLFRQKILSNVSKGRGDMILEEESLRKPMKKKDVDEVTDAFFSYLRRSWEKGDLILHGDEDTLVY
jgi:flagellar motor switch protein FliG